jgi:hypothetical protein
MLSNSSNLQYCNNNEVKMNYSKCLFSVVLLLFCTGLFAGPFGLEMGMSLEDIGGESKKEGVSYVFKNVPKPHSAFDYYILKIAPTGGGIFCYSFGKVYRM